MSQVFISYRQTGQIGRGRGVTFNDAIAYLRSCPEGNDPLEFIFGDLVEDFSEAETRVLCALMYFTLPATLEHIFPLAECAEAEAARALRSLTNRSLVVPSEEMKTFALVPLVADFLRKKKPEVVADTGDRLEKRAFALVMENGYQQHDLFPVLDAAWPTIAAAMPRFISGPNDQLQTVCNALQRFLEFTGRWDEALALLRDAESRAVTEKDFAYAGWRAHHAGWIYYLRGQSAEVLYYADRAEEHWRQAEAPVRERASAIRLRGLGHRLAKDYLAATRAFHQAVELWRMLDPESEDVAIGLNSVAEVERLSGDLSAAERDYREALRIARVIDYREGIAAYNGNLAALALDREDWVDAETLGRQALLLSEKIGRQDLIASDCRHLAKALARQSKKAEGRPYARRAVEIFTRLGSSELADALEILVDCESSERK